jgi:hypothetical protein
VSKINTDLTMSRGVNMAFYGCLFDSPGYVNFEIGQNVESAWMAVRYGVLYAITLSH